MILRLNRRDRTLFLSAVGAAGILTAAGWGLSVLGRHAPPASPSVPRTANRLDAPGRIVPETTAVPDTMAAVPEKVQERAGTPAELRPRQGLELEPPYLIQDGLTFVAGQVAVRLDGLDGPPAQATCRNANGDLWACGLQARAALNNETRNHKIRCTVKEMLPGGMLLAICNAEGKDLGERLAGLGWARPSDGQPTLYAAAAEEARRTKRGLWNGDWTFAERGPAPEIGTDLRRAFDAPRAQSGN